MNERTQNYIAIIVFFSTLPFISLACKTEEKPVEISLLRICHPSPKQAQFVIDCAKAANPMSDEEGEDLVEQCEETSHRLFQKECSESIPHYKDKNSEWDVWVLCEKATLGSRERVACTQASSIGAGGSK